MILNWNLPAAERTGNLTTFGVRPEMFLNG
jgi:hypothetical protein